jgi:hypothetical protein
VHTPRENCLLTLPWTIAFFKTLNYFYSVFSKILPHSPNHLSLHSNWNPKKCMNSITSVGPVHLTCTYMPTQRGDTL